MKQTSKGYYFLEGDYTKASMSSSGSAGTEPSYTEGIFYFFKGSSNQSVKNENSHSGAERGGQKYF